MLVLCSHDTRIRRDAAVRAGLPPGLESVILRLLAKEPAHRYASAAEARTALMRTEARRALAHVQFRARDYEAVVRLCDEIHALVAGRESRVSQLCAGPVHVEALVALGQTAAARHCFETYRDLVADCQAPFYSREAERLAALLGPGV